LPRPGPAKGIEQAMAVCGKGSSAPRATRSSDGIGGKAGGRAMDDWPPRGFHCSHSRHCRGGTGEACENTMVVDVFFGCERAGGERECRGQGAGNPKAKSQAGGGLPLSRGRGALAETWSCLGPRCGEGLAMPWPGLDRGRWLGSASPNQAIKNTNLLKVFFECRPAGKGNGCAAAESSEPYRLIQSESYPSAWFVFPHRIRIQRKWTPPRPIRDLSQGWTDGHVRRVRCVPTLCHCMPLPTGSPTPR